MAAQNVKGGMGLNHGEIFMNIVKHYPYLITVSQRENWQGKYFFKER